MQAIACFPASLSGLNGVDLGSVQALVRYLIYEFELT